MNYLNNNSKVEMHSLFTNNLELNSSLNMIDIHIVVQTKLPSSPLQKGNENKT